MSPTRSSLTCLVLTAAVSGCLQVGPGGYSQGGPDGTAALDVTFQFNGVAESCQAAGIDGIALIIPNVPITPAVVPCSDSAEIIINGLPTGPTILTANAISQGQIVYTGSESLKLSQGYNTFAMDLVTPETDAGVAPVDAGESAPDAGESTAPDAGESTAPDAGESTAPDAGESTAPDAGETVPDAGAPDAGPPVTAQICTTLTTAMSQLAADEGTCTSVSAAVPVFVAAQCGPLTEGCTLADGTTLGNLASCIDALPACDPSFPSIFLGAASACGSGVFSQLSPSCQAAYTGSTDGG
jgi:hypothetical protein